jgi:PAS domain S-box-containing protein
MVALRTGKEVRNVVMGVFNPRQESYLWISICAVPEFRPGESQPYQMFTTFEDITERMRAEETLKKSARLLMDTGEMAKVGGWELDLATKEVSWTEEVGRIHGVEPGFRPKLEEALSFYAAESRPALEAVLKKAAETGEPYDLESLFIPSGSKDKIWVRSLGRAVYSGGKIVKLTGTFQNIDKYKKVEETLRQSEEGFRTLVESITDYAYKATVRDGRVVETVHGPGCLGVTGYSPEEFRADPELWFRMVHPGDQPAVLDRANKLLSGRKIGPLEHRIIHKNGETRWVRNSAVPRHDGRGQFIGYEGLIQDITEYRRLQDQFAQAQKMEAIGQLAGGVAHDFRNQLSVIKGYGEMLLRRDLVKDEGRIKVEQILEAADRSTRITGQLLAFGRKQTLRPEVANVNSVTGEMMKSLAQTIGEDIRLSIVPRGELWNIRVDTGQFQQALLNLVLNARDAMAQGGQLTIETENIVLDEDFVSRHVGASAGRHVVLTVSDTGCGMTHEMLDRLFEPFFTTKPVGEGTGLGLAMVHGFVAQSGGFIDVQSRPDKPAGHGIPTYIGTVPGGTTFRLYFPAVQDAAESAQSPSQAPDLPRGSGTILVVEDEDAIRQILLDMLGECGYTVLTAGNAQQAMTLIESAKEKIDLLITDVVMPGWSGPELARHFQAARPGAAVLLISGHTGKILTGHGVVPADVNLLAKPFSAQTLAETVRKILGQTKRP